MSRLSSVDQDDDEVIQDDAAAAPEYQAPIDQNAGANAAPATPPDNWLALTAEPQQVFLIPDQDTATISAPEAKQGSVSDAQDAEVAEAALPANSSPLSEPQTPQQDMRVVRSRPSASHRYHLYS